MIGEHGRTRGPHRRVQPCSGVYHPWRPPGGRDRRQDAENAQPARGLPPSRRAFSAHVVLAWACRSRLRKHRACSTRRRFLEAGRTIRVYGSQPPRSGVVAGFIFFFWFSPSFGPRSSTTDDTLSSARAVHPDFYRSGSPSGRWPDRRRRPLRATFPSDCLAQAHHGHLQSRWASFSTLGLPPPTVDATSPSSSPSRSARQHDHQPRVSSTFAAKACPAQPFEARSSPR